MGRMGRMWHSCFIIDGGRYEVLVVAMEVWLSQPETDEGADGVDLPLMERE